MTTQAPVKPGTRRQPGLAGWAAINALAAWGGAVGLATGALDFGTELDRRLPFGSLGLAACALGLLVAVPLTVLAVAAWNGDPRTAPLAVAVGVDLVVWIGVQLAFLRALSFFQPFYLAVGLGFVVVGHLRSRDAPAA